MYSPLANPSAWSQSPHSSQAKQPPSITDGKRRIQSNRWMPVRNLRSKMPLRNRRSIDVVALWGGYQWLIGIARLGPKSHPYLEEQCMIMMMIHSSQASVFSDLSRQATSKSISSCLVKTWTIKSEYNPPYSCFIVGKSYWQAPHQRLFRAAFARASDLFKTLQIFLL
jgi:hypothetical protein